MKEVEMGEASKTHGNIRNACKILDGKPELKRLFGRNYS
jgi:hypothetical protein